MNASKPVVHVDADIADRFLGLTAEGYQVIKAYLTATRAWSYPLTPCCNAAVTYSDVELCCKACWNEVPLDLDVTNPTIATPRDELDVVVTP